VQDQLASMYIPAELSGWGRKELDQSKLVYHYEVFDYDEAVKSYSSKNCVCKKI